MILVSDDALVIDEWYSLRPTDVLDPRIWHLNFQGLSSLRVKFDFTSFSSHLSLILVCHLFVLASVYGVHYYNQYFFPLSIFACFLYYTLIFLCGLVDWRSHLQLGFPMKASSDLLSLILLTALLQPFNRLDSKTWHLGWNLMQKEL